MTGQEELPPFTPSREMPSYTPAAAVTANPPPAYPRSPYPAPGYGGRPASKAMATWALGLAILPMPLGNLAAIALAVRALRRGRDGRDHGSGRAITALVIAPLWLLVTLVVVAQGLAAQADRDPSGAVTQRGDVAVTSVEVGDCLPANVSTVKETLTVEVAPCSQPHASEAYSDFDLAAGPFPGNALVVRLAEGGCAKRFRTFVGVRYDKSRLDVTYMYPTSRSWLRRDRSVTCLVGAASPTTGTLKGSRR
jgi:hypothetical protein